MMTALVAKRQTASLVAKRQTARDHYKPQRDGQRIGCTTPRYETKERAAFAQRRIARGYSLHTLAEHCKTCLAYHVVAGAEQVTLPKHWQHILTRVAQGFTDKEIGDELGIHAHNITRFIKKLLSRFYALSRTNLIAIALSLGMIDPLDMAPAPQKGCPNAAPANL